MDTNQRANALQRARQAETAAFQLATYLDDLGSEPVVGEVRELVEIARSHLRSATHALVNVNAERKDGGAK